MSTGRQEVFLSPCTNRLRIYVAKCIPFILPIIILICKLLVFTGLFITIFSNHWAKDPVISDLHAGYKNRCSVHVCMLNNMDPVWLVDLTCLLAIINLIIELVNISLVCLNRYRVSKILIILEVSVFLSTFIVTDFGIIFGVYITIYTHELPMGYAYKCFISSIIFSIIDWGFSLKRLISNWPVLIYLPEHESLFHNHPTAYIFRTEHSALTEEHSNMTARKSNTIEITEV